MVRSRAEALRVLGLSEDPRPDEVRRAYRRLARRHHPDAGGDAHEFQRLQQALELLQRPRAAPPPPRRSPSTSTHTRPSTSGPTRGWGETTTRWFEGTVTDDADWTRTLPTPPHAWERELLTVALAAPGDGPVSEARGRSRRPGSRWNRLTPWLAAEWSASWVVAPASGQGRGRDGHDVEVRLTFPPGRGRKAADATPLPHGWVTERRPNSTVITLLIVPSRDRHQTCLRAAAALAEGLDRLGWPLPQWYRT